MELTVISIHLPSHKDGLIEGDLSIPNEARGIVLFAHGIGSSRHSHRNQHVAQVLNDAGIATLLVDLFTNEEKEIDSETLRPRFDIQLLADRFKAATNWILQNPQIQNLPIGFFGSSTGAAAALIAAAELSVGKAIVSRGGRPDLADSKKILQNVQIPTLLIVGQKDDSVIPVNEKAFTQLVQVKNKQLVIIPGATHVFEEPGAMEEVARITTNWFKQYLFDDNETNAEETIKTGNKIITKEHNSSRFSSLFRNRPTLQLKFKDRRAAGNVLASVLKGSLSHILKDSKNDVIVLGVARGGMIVAQAIAEKLSIDLDVVLVRRLRAPYNEENAIGAIMPDRTTYIDENIVRCLQIKPEYIEQEMLEQNNELGRRIALFRDPAKGYRLGNRIVILVDDGIATGATVIAAARWIKKQKPKKLIVAAPVCPKPVMEMLKAEADDIEVIRMPSNFKPVEQFYQDFEPVTDAEVIRIMGMKR